MSVQKKNLKLDAKKRVTLGKLAPEEVTSYDVEVREDGVILLHPKVEIPAQELWLYQNKEALDSVRRGIDNSATGKTEQLNNTFWDGLGE